MPFFFEFTVAGCFHVFQHGAKTFDFGGGVLFAVPLFLCLPDGCFEGGEGLLLRRSEVQPFGGGQRFDVPEEVGFLFFRSRASDAADEFC